MNNDMVDAFKYSMLAHSNAIKAAKQRKEQRIHEAIVLIMCVVAGLAAFFLVAPLMAHVLFAVYNFFTGKDVTL